MAKNNEINIENTKAQMRRGILEFCILLIISEGRAYASDILRQLKRADLIVVEGTIYPLLARSKNSGLLEYEWEESSSGPPRKYYRLTQHGHRTLKDLKNTWEALDNSINNIIKKYN